MLATRDKNTERSPRANLISTVVPVDKMGRQEQEQTSNIKDHIIRSLIFLSHEVIIFINMTSSRK